MQTATPFDVSTAVPLSVRRPLNPPRGRPWLGLACLLVGCASGALAEENYSVRQLPLGEEIIECVIRELGPPSWLFCNLHDDENTSVQAARRVLKGRGGIGISQTDKPGACRLITLSNAGQRNLIYRLAGRRYQVDPNRIFTSQGVRMSLKQLSEDEPAAREAARRCGQTLLHIYRLDEVSAVVALHNNSESNYSATSYLTDAELSRDAAQVNLVAERDPDDFFFVTEPWMYSALVERGFNVVLQDSRQVTDDGSLSVYCARLGLCYVNVEAQHGHLEQQVEMLEALLPLLPTERAHANPSGTVDQEADPRAELELDLVNLAEIDPTFVIDARYATAQNLTGKPLYPRNELYLERSAAERLARVQKALREQGYGLKILDAYRPLSVQKKLWAVVPDPRYVADPSQGSRHNRGSAVDVTLVDEKGGELAMPTEFDEFSDKAHRDYADLPPEVIRHRTILERAMVAEGFIPLPTEWWHFDAPGWEKFPVVDLDPYTRQGK